MGKDSSKVATAIAFIQRRGSARTPEIAEHLGIHVHSVSAVLWHACKTGKLVSCEVRRPGQTPINEYRIGAGQPQVGMTPMQTYRLRGADATRNLSGRTLVPAGDLLPTGDALKSALRARGSENVEVKSEPAADAKPRSPKMVDLKITTPPVWALTSAGTFVQIPSDRTSVQLGDAAPIEIPTAAARSLVEFIRRLDAAEV